MDFKIEMEAIDNAITVYDKAIRELKNNLNSLNSGFSGIKGDGWKGKAKDSFMTIKYGQWEKGLKEHISRLEFLNSMLKDAREKLDALVTEGEQL